jgi:hypothetical protein
LTLYRRFSGRVRVDARDGGKRRPLTQEREMFQIPKRLVLTTGVLLALLIMPNSASAHCDSLDGPVVKAAEQAIAAGEVERVLMWVRPEDEDEIRAAFRRTLEVRRPGGPAQELADRWFFETLVRVHRAGEGAPYTGLKPAGYEPPGGIAAADRALAVGEVEPLLTGVTDAVAQELQHRFERVHALSDHDPADVEAGRRYVHAYVEYIHFVEALHDLLQGHGEAHMHMSSGGAPHNQ